MWQGRVHDNQPPPPRGLAEDTARHLDGGGHRRPQVLAPTSWLTFLQQFAGSFTAPGRLVFDQLITAWVLCPGRRTLTRLWSVIPPAVRQRYGAYARFVREGRWEMDELWRRLVVHLVQHWVEGKQVILLLDDTLVNKSGRKVDGAGYFHDPVTSTAVARKVSAWGLNVVILALCLPTPWPGVPLALPVLASVHRKGESELSLIELAAAMIACLAKWLPEHHFRVIADGAYASIIRYPLPRTVVISRIRRNAALFELPPPRTGRRGRPRTKGERLPTPPELADQATNWMSAEIRIRGRTTERLLWARQVLWYQTAKSRPLLLVIVRDPKGHQSDDFFLSTDLALLPADVASSYSDRWAIEDTHRHLKQHLGIRNPQSWVKLGPERIVCLAGWLYSAIWHWYLTNVDLPLWPERPWYRSKQVPSFADALASLRRQSWSAIFAPSIQTTLTPQISDQLISVLADAA
jgi:DDE superfamily endonuclease